jgi:biopolymer transport protein ExbD
MAYKPSMRRNTENLEMELDIRPVMNLMVVLIPLLIVSAEWVKLSVLEINIPPSKNVGGGGGDNNNQENKEKEKVLGLKIAISHDGITVGNAVTILANEGGDDAGPTIPKNPDGTYNYDLLRKKLIEVKKKIVGKGYVDEDRAVITASADIEYQVIIDVMDKIQTYEEGNNVLPLFPQINFGNVL